MKSTFLFFAFVTIGIAFPSQSSALTVYEPKYTDWGWSSGGAVVVVLGTHCGVGCTQNLGPYVVIQNNNPVDPSYRNCIFFPLPNTLTDNVIIRGGPGNDIVVLNPTGQLSVKCGGGVFVPVFKGIGNTSSGGPSFSQFLANSTYWAAAQGGAGNDFVDLGIGTGYSLCYGHGMDGNDFLNGNGEGVDLYGGNHNDKLRQSNAIAGLSATNETWLYGQEGDDCLHAASITCSSGNANLVCGGGGFDIRSSQGSCSVNFASCENATNAICMGKGPGGICVSSSDCQTSLGSSCASGTCSQWW